MHTRVPRERIPADVSFAAHLQVRAGECALLGACPPHVVPRTLPGAGQSSVPCITPCDCLLGLRLLYPVYCTNVAVHRPLMASSSRVAGCPALLLAFPTNATA